MSSTNGRFAKAFDLFFKHFWKILCIAVIVLYVLGKLPLEPKDLIDFFKEMKE